MYPLPTQAKIALSFSGGKDSAACLKLLGKQLDQVTVVWCNSGDSPKPLLAYMERIRERVPHFVEVKGDQPAFKQAHGYAVDMVPVWSTVQGLRVRSDAKASPAYASPLECCGANRWNPLMTYLFQEGFTHVIRGQKKSDLWQNKQAKEAGTQLGIEFLYPLEEWTDEEVFSYLGPDVPPLYAEGAKSSMDCRTCLAYTEENPNRFEVLRKVDAAAYEELLPVHRHYRSLLKRALQAEDIKL